MGYNKVNLTYPQTDDDLSRLADFCDYLIDRTGEDENHPLTGLIDIVGTLIERLLKLLGKKPTRRPGAVR